MPLEPHPTDPEKLVFRAHHIPWEKSMDKDTIIRLAREAGFIDADEKGVWITDGYWDEELAAFAALVAAHEREACAKVCDEWAMFQLAFDLAGQIRARSRT